MKWLSFQKTVVTNLLENQDKLVDEYMNKIFAGKILQNQNI